MGEKKRGDGEGSKPRKRRDGRWEARYTDASGHRRSVYAPTRKEVAAKFANALAHRDDAPAFKPKNVTVRDFCTEYQEAVRDSLKRRSFENTSDVMRLHLMPEFGRMKLKDLSREVVQRMYARKRDAGLSAARVSCVHRVLSAALNTAVRWRYLEHNVCKEVAATRHTCTCILLLEGVNPKSVAMQMGWSSVAFMLENYARFLPGWGDNGAMDEALS